MYHAPYFQSKQKEKVIEHPDSRTRGSTSDDINVTRDGLKDLRPAASVYKCRDLNRCIGNEGPRVYLEPEASSLLVIGIRLQSVDNYSPSTLFNSFLLVNFWFFVVFLSWVFYFSLGTVDMDRSWAPWSKSI